jgi:hypothetical protein
VVTLKKATLEELRTELEERERTFLLAPAPASVDSLDYAKLAKLRNAVVSHMAEVADKHPDPEEHYIVAAALQLFYGDDVYDYINSIYK